ncbi:MAG: cadherin-like domain-containing protein [Cytophagaceae bacterium]|nr:cadherin-like domain-containing protein [Gemmatimonadaceae bacterium]
MRRPALLLATSWLAITACSESPTGAPVVSLPPTVSTDLTPGANPACTHTWANAVNGNWDDATKWSPASIPGSTASVCITAAGTYTVVLGRTAGSAAAAIDALTIGGTSGLASLDLGPGFATGPGDIDVAQHIAIGTMGRLRLGRGSIVSGGVITVDGNLSSISPCCAGAQTIRGDILNRGTIDFQHPLLLDKVNAAYENHGAWNIGTNLLAGQVTIPASAGNTTFAMKAGSITGGGPLAFQMHGTAFSYTGGTPGTRGSGHPVVRIINGSLDIASPLLGPAHFDLQSASGGSITLTGGIGAGQRVRFGGDGAGGSGTLHLAGGMTIDGIFESAPFAGLAAHHRYVTSDAPVTVGANGKVILTGSGDFTHAQLDLVNNGLVDIKSQLIFDGAGRTFTNNGSIPAQNFAIFLRSGATMHNGVVGQALATVNVESAGLLTGGGTFRLIHVHDGGTVSPGSSTGVMTASSFTMHPNSALIMEVGGTVPGSSHDQIVATGNVVYDGTLTIVNLPGFQAGACGQVVDLILDSSPGGRGLFDQVTGLATSPTTAWRVWNPKTPGRYSLVGHNPLSPITVGPSPLAASEGGPGVPYKVCVRQQPTADVTVTTQPDAQVTTSPTSVVFTSANWALPLTVDVTAVDDNVNEGTHTGAVGHVVASTDPAYSGGNPGAIAVTIADNDAPVNQAPIAQPDNATTPMVTTITIPVLANDSDPDLDPLSVTTVTIPQHGAAQVAPSAQAVIYTPAQGFSGTDTFSYTVSDPNGGSTTATVTVLVTVPVNQAPTAAFTMTCTTKKCVLDASSSTDDQGIVSYAWSAPGTGRPAVTGPTVTRFVSTHYVNSWQETLTVTDAQGLSNSITLTVTIPPTGTDLPPVAAFTVTCDAVKRSCTLNAASSTDDRGIASYAWTTNAAGRPAKSGVQITRFFAQQLVNSWQETLTVTDSGGQTHSITQTVTIP